MAHKEPTEKIVLYENEQDHKINKIYYAIKITNVIDEI